jgi:hypothetical protein
MVDFSNTTRHPVAWFKDVHDKRALILRPPFQRNPVWTDSQKSYLIDSILRGYPVPELYMQETVDSKGRQKYTVVDGQQRITACLDFLEDSFSLTEEDSPEWADLTFSDLSESQKQKIYSYSFIVRQIPDISEEQLREVFKRLNRSNVVLNRQELRHATYWGPFIKCVEALADLDYWGGSGVFTANDVRRMLDSEFVSELAVGVIHGPQNKKLSLDKWYETYENDFPDQNRVENTFRSVLGELTKILPNIKDTRWSKKSDFYTLFLCLASHVDNLPLSKGSRQRAGKALCTFGASIDRALSNGGQGGTRKVDLYVKSVEKAASDLSNRRRRAEILEAVLNGVW